MAELEYEETALDEPCSSICDEETAGFPSNAAVSTENTSKETSFGPFSDKAAISLQALQRGEVEPLNIEHFTVGLVLELNKHKSSWSELLQWITLLAPSEERAYLAGVNCKNLNKTITSLYKKNQNLNRNRKTENLEGFRKRLFCLPGRSAQMRVDSMSPKTKTIHDLRQKNEKLKRSFDELEENSVLREGQNKLAEDYSGLEAEYNSVLQYMTKITNEIASLKTEHKTEKEQLKNNLKILQGQFSEQSEKLNEIQAKLASYTPRNVNKTRKRAKTTISNLKLKQKSLSEQLEKEKVEKEEHRKKVEEAESQLTALKKEKLQLQKSLSYTKKKRSEHLDHVNTLKGENETRMIEMQNKIKELEKSNDELEKLQALMEDDLVTSFIDGRYTNTVREVIMELLSMNISMNKVNDVIKTVLKKLAGKDIERLPTKAVHSRLLVEAKFIADVQVGKAMLANVDPTSILGNTLHGDGTSKYHRHYQDFEVTTPAGQTYSIGLLEMGKQDTEAIVDAFKFRIQEIASALSDSQQETEVAVKVAKLVTSVKNTMSDQGPTNAPFNEQLETIRTELLPQVVDNWSNLDEDTRDKLKEMGNFYCKMHLLVNMAEEANKALKIFEKAATEGQNLFAFGSSDSGAGRLTRTSCEAFHPRGSQNAGAASEFNAYLNEVGAEKNWMVQFIGNRFNILFYNSAAVFFHKEHIEEFLTKLPSLNRLQQAVLKDITEAVNLAGIRALGILDKVVTGPFFRVAENASSVLDLNPFLERMQAKFQEWSQDASPLLEGETLFDEAAVPIHRDEVYDSLFAGQEVQVEVLTQEALELIFHSWIILLERQAKDQLPGGKYSNPSPDLQTQAKNVPATNMASERDFGLFDLLLRSKPSARVIFYEALIMWTNNKTVAWLDSLSAEEKDRMMESARANFTKISQRYRQRKGEILQQKREKLMKKQEQKQQKEGKMRQERVKLTAAVTALGGPWTTAEHIVRGLNNLQSEKQKREALVSQLQFQKTVIQAVAPSKEHFQQGKTADGKRILFSVDQLSKHLIEILITNKLHQLSEQDEDEGGLMYRTDAERTKQLSEEKARCAKKLREQRQKLRISKSKEELQQLLQKPDLLVGKRVQHNCIEGDNKEIQDWFDGTVLRIASNNDNTLKTEYIIKYDLEPDDLEWKMPLLTDLQNNDLIIADQIE